MKPFRFLLFPFTLTILAGLACALPDAIPSLATATARAALTATVEAGGDYALENGLIIGSYETIDKAIDAQAPILDSLATERYEAAELSQAGETYAFTIDLQEEQTLLWQTNWCTTSEEILEENLDLFQIHFTADDQTIDPAHIGVIQTRSDDLYCAYFIVAVSNWPQGQAVVLSIAITFTEALNDGIGDYPQGTHTYQYTVTLE